MQGEFYFPSTWGKDGQAIGYGGRTTMVLTPFAYERGSAKSAFKFIVYYYPIFATLEDCKYFMESIDCLKTKASFMSIMDLWRNFSQKMPEDDAGDFMPSDDFQYYADVYGWPIRDVFDGYFAIKKDINVDEMVYPLFKKPVYVPPVFKKGEKV